MTTDKEKIHNLNEASLLDTINTLELKLQDAVHDLARRDEEIRRLKMERDQLVQSAQNANLRQDGTYRQLQHLMNRKDVWEREREIAYQARDENALEVANLRERVFDLEHGLDDKIAAAEGRATAYKMKLRNILIQMDAMYSQLRIEPPEDS